MFKKIKFASNNKHLTFPVVGKDVLPNWYRNHSLTINRSKNLLDENNASTATFKKCMPVFDALTSGFFVVLESDIQVTQQNGEAFLQWTSDIDPVALRDGTHTSTDSVPAGYSSKAWVWLNRVLMQVPKGYSVLITHPLNRFDLPFITMSAIVDADVALHEGKIPFYLLNNYVGIIKKGTPIFQVIPFRRESWQSEKDDSLIEKTDKNSYSIRSYIRGWYKHNVWQKKNFKDGIN